MKIGIIGDTHFGAGYNLGKIDARTQLNTRLLDFQETFDRIIDNFVERDVKLVVLTGDIFESRHPTSAQLNMFSKCIRRAVNKDLDIVIVVGNHDQQRTISTTTLDIFNLLELDRVSVYQEMETHTILDKNGDKTNLFLMPYRDRRMLDAQNCNEAIGMLKAELGVLKRASDWDDSTNILIGHYMIDKTIEGERPDTFSINELILPTMMFDGFDAVVMGHIHKHAIVSMKNPVIIYSGSMEKVSFGEKHHSKVSIILNTEDVNKAVVLKSRVRCLYELNFDYTESNKLYKHAINDKMIDDINKFCDSTNIKGAIIKFIAKVSDNDLYHVNQRKVREHILSKLVQHIASIQITAINTRQLRNRSITENLGGKKAMGSFINGLLEPEQVKRKLQLCADKIISEVEKK